MTTPGWYNDEQDPALARWHDGRDWTTETLVIAEWTGQGEPPPPVIAPPLVPPPPAPWFDGPTDDDATVALDPVDGWDSDLDVDLADEWDDDEILPPRHGLRTAPGPTLPRYAAPVAALAALLLAVLALNLVRGGDDGDGDVRETAAVGDIDAAVEAARGGLPARVAVTDSDLKALIRGLCDVAGGGSTETVAEDAAMAVDTADQLDPVLAAAAWGAARFCPEATGAGGAVDEVAAAASLRLGTVTTLPSTVDPAAATSDDGTSGPSGSSGSTTRAGSTTQPTTRGSSNGGVVRTETRSNSSTNPVLPGNNNDTTSGDESSVGNEATNNQTTNTVIRPTTTTSTVPAETTTTTIAAATEG